MKMQQGQQSDSEDKGATVVLTAASRPKIEQLKCGQGRRQKGRENREMVREGRELRLKRSKSL